MRTQGHGACSSGRVLTRRARDRSSGSFVYYTARRAGRISPFPGRRKNSFPDRRAAVGPESAPGGSAQRPEMIASWTIRGATVVRDLPVRVTTRAVAKYAPGAWSSIDQRATARTNLNPAGPN